MNLRNHNELMNQLADSLPTLIAIAGCDLNYAFVNKAYASFYGLDPVNIVGRSVESVIGKKAFETIEPMLKESISGLTLTHEFHRVSAKGDRGIHKSTYTPYYHEAAVAGVMVTSTEITALRFNEKALKKSKDENEAILKAIPDMMFRISDQGVFLDCYNPKDDELYATPQKFIGSTIWEIFSPEIATKAVEHIHLAINTGELTQYSYTLNIDGLTQHFENRIVKISDQDVLSIVRNITDTRASEQTIRLQRDLATGLGKNRDISQSFDLIIETLLSLEAIDCGGIYIVNEENSRLELITHRGLSDAFVGRVMYYDFESPQYRMVNNLKPVYARYEQLIPGDSTPAERDHILSLASIPVESDGKLIGVLNLGSRTVSHLPQRIREQTESLSRLSGEAFGRLLAEKALVTSRENFKRLFDTIDDFLFILDEKGNIILTNQTVEQQLGYSAEQLGTMNVLEVHPPDRRDEAAAIVGEMLAGKTKFCPIPLADSKGNFIPVETRVVRGVWNGQNVLFGISRDITERKVAEMALRKKTEELETFFNVAPDLLCITDTEGRFVKVNEAWPQLLGYPIEEIEQSSISQFLHPDDISVLGNALNDLRHCTSVYSFTTRMRRHDESYVFIEWRSAPLGNQLYSAARDITSHKRIEDSLKVSITREKELNELKSRFVSMASHEFRTPLASIMMSAEMLLNYRSRLSEDQFGETAGNIIEQTRHLTGVVTEIMDVARAQEGRLEVQLKKGDLVATIKKIASRFNHSPHLKRKIEVITPNERLEMWYDEQAMIQILNNLLSNAVKYSAPNPEIQVRVARMTDGLRVTVSDNGIGIPEPDRRHLLNPFYRATNVGSIPGSGLGLSIVNELMRLHQGSIEFQNRPGGGTDFTFTLPSKHYC